ncbi:MAG TPA: hypothetical protein PLQ13_02245, partial [Candidatus Krumholzibacteria bacterium]|nr:hypothetical protein [Candidatus Krumholzibacteria bacterium]
RHRLLVQGWGTGVDMGKYILDEQSVARIGLTAETAEQVIAQVEPEFQELRELYITGARGAGRPSRQPA